MPISEKDTIDVLVKEIDILNDYYKKTLDNRAETLNMYFKIVTVPAGALVGIFIFLSRSMSAEEIDAFSSSSTANLIVSALLLVTLTGLGIIFTYSAENANATRYDEAMKRARARMKELNPLFGDGVSVHELRSNDGKHPLAALLSIKLWRAMPISIINSGFLSFFLSFHDYTIVSSWITFAVCLVFHLALSLGVYHMYNSQRGLNSRPQMPTGPTTT